MVQVNTHAHLIIEAYNYAHMVTHTNQNAQAHTPPLYRNQMTVSFNNHTLITSMPQLTQHYQHAVCNQLIPKLHRALKV